MSAAPATVPDGPRPTPPGDAPRDTFALAAGFVRTMAACLGWRLAPALGVSVALALTEGVGLLLLIPLLQAIGLVVSDGPAGRVADWMTAALSSVGLALSLETVLAVFLAISVAYAGLYRWYLLLGPRLEQQFVLTLRHRLYASVVSARWSFLVQRRATDLAHALTTELDRAGASAHQLLTLVASLGVTAMYITVAARLAPALTAVVAAAALILLALLQGRTRESLDRSAEYSDATRRVHGLVNESLGGLKVAKSTGAETRDAAAFRHATRTASDLYLRLIAAFAQSKARVDLASAAGVSLLVLVAVRGFDIRGASLLLIVFVFARVMPRMLSLQESLQLFVTGLPAFRNVMDLQRECDAEAERLSDEGAPRLDLTRTLRLEGVCFAYGRGPAATLDGVDLDIEAGHTTAIVGPSGEGKSTLADVMMGLLVPDAGRLLVDGQPLSPDRLLPWRRGVAYVPQDTFLLHDSIRANLAWAQPGAAEHEMWEALGLAAARGFVAALPEGLDTVVGDRGIRLSGGERQRLALARALLRRPSLLILDEATSALDSANERHIMDAIRRLHGRTTIVLITHRLSLVREADVIHVLARGRIVESGTWSQLSSRTGTLFGRLWQLQRTEAVEA